MADQFGFVLADDRDAVGVDGEVLGGGCQGDGEAQSHGGGDADMGAEHRQQCRAGH